MRPSIIQGCILILLCQSCAGAEELIFFADDHYKALGGPDLHASAINPVIEPGRSSVLRIIMTNDGRINELIPISGNGSDADIALEIGEELHSVDAQNITASLLGDEQVYVTSGPCHIDLLPSGSVAEVEFNISADDSVSGRHDLQMIIEYEHQVDVSVFDGMASPLYLPGNASQIIGVKVLGQGSDGLLRVLGVNSDISPGSTGIVSAAIKNAGSSLLRNCTLHLMAAPPFHPSEEGCDLGDIGPGDVAVAKFPMKVDGDAGLKDYSLACEVLHKDGKIVITFPLALEKGSGMGFVPRFSYGQSFAHILLVLMVAGATAAFLAIRTRRFRLTRLSRRTMYSRLTRQIRALRRRGFRR